MTIDVYTIFFATGELRLQVPTMICDVKSKKKYLGTRDASASQSPDPRSLSLTLVMVVNVV